MTGAGAERAGYGDRARQVLQLLAAHPGGLTAAQITDILGVTAATRTGALTKTGGTLRQQTVRGRIAVAGREPGRGWQQPGSIRYQLTAAGRSWLELQAIADLRAAAEMEAAWQIEEALAGLDAKAAAISQARLELAEAARSARSPLMTREQVKTLARILRRAGLSLRAIGDTFGVSGEAVRKTLL